MAFGITEGLLAGSGMVADLAGSFLNERFALKNQHQAQDFERDMFSRRYQTQVEDLRKAGLNPMLAYQQSPGGVPGSSAAGYHESNIGSKGVSSYNEAKIASAQEGNLAAQAAKAAQDVKIGIAQEANIKADTLGKLKVPSLIASQVVHNTASAQQADAARQRIEAEIPKIKQEIEEIKQKIKTQKSSVELNNALIRAQNYLNGLHAADMFLKEAQLRNTALEGDILRPKARAAGYHSAEYGHVADNIGKVGSAAWKFMFPTLSK